MADLIPPMVLTIEARIGKLEADLKKATDAVDKFGKQAKSDTKNASGLTDGFKKMALAVGGLMIIHQLTSFMKDSAKAATDDAKSQGLLALALKNSTGATNEQITAVEKSIKGLEMMSAVADDKIRPAFATLARATGDVTKATGLMRLALDVSAGTGKDVQAVSAALAKAYGGQTTALNKLVPGVANAADKIAWLEEKFKGSAAAAANLDPIQRLNLVFENLQETVGTYLIPFLNQFADWLNSPKGQTQISKIAAIFKVIAELVGQTITWLLDNTWAVKLIAGVALWAKSLGVVFGVTKAIYAVIKATAIGEYVAKAVSSAKTWQQALVIGGVAVATGIAAFVATDALIGGIDTKVQGLTKSTEKLATVTLPDLPGAQTPSGAVPAATKDAFVTYLQNTQKQILAARATYDKAVQAANEKYGALIKQYSDEMTSIIQQSMDRLRTVFATATATDVGSIFSDLAQQGDATADLLLKRLQDKLNAGKKLAENAAALAGLGYSQVFIEQVIAQGTDTGNALAEALKVASPETAKALQDTFKESETLSNTGMDSLAKSMYEKSGLATDELKSLFDTAQKNMVQAQTDLQNALLAAASTLNDSLTSIEAAFTAKLASMGDKAKKYQKDIRATFGLLAENFVDNAAPITSDIMPGGGSRGNVMRVASVGGGHVFNISTTANTNASAETIAQATLNAAKFGIPAVI